MEQHYDMWRMESPRAFGVALRALRERRGLTQQQLAEQLGTTRQRISRMEDGKLADQLLLVLRELRLLDAVLRLEVRDEP